MKNPMARAVRSSRHRAQAFSSRKDYNRGKEDADIQQRLDSEEAEEEENLHRQEVRNPNEV